MDERIAADLKSPSKGSIVQLLRAIGGGDDHHLLLLPCTAHHASGGDFFTIGQCYQGLI
jgi:hypothetical protein